MRRGWRLAVPAIATVCAVMLGAPAASAATGKVTQIAGPSGSLTVVFGADGLAEGVRLQAETVRLRIADRPVRATATPLSEAGGAKVTRTAMLVIDTSGSMQGEGIAGAKAAAKNYLSAVPADVRVGLISFSARASLRVAPTTDRAAVGRAVNALKASGETALYDAVQLGLKSLGTGGVRSLVLLSDGADTTSKASLASVVSAAKSAKVSIDAVGFKTSQSVGSVLGQIAASGSGQVIAAGRAADIAEAFKVAALNVSNQLVVTAAIPADLAGNSQTVEVTARAGTETVSAVAVFLLGAASDGPVKTQPQGPKPVSDSVGPLSSQTALYGAIGGIFLGLLLLLVVAAASMGGRQDRGVRRRLSIYTLTGRNVQEERSETTVLGDSAVARSAVEFAGRVVRQRDFETGLARRLDAGGVPLKPAEFLLIHVGVAIATPVLLLLLSGGSAAAALVGLIIGVLLPLGYLAFKEQRRTANFLNQLPDTLQLLAGSLSAGYSFPQAVDAVVQEGSQPIAAEFNKALIESRLGVPIEDAMEGIAARMKSKDFAWVIMAVRIQREVGGNLAEVLTTVAATLRERERIRRQVRTLSAEGRLSAAILFALPIVFSIYLLLVRGSYIRVLYTDPLGLLMLVGMLVLLTVGGFWLRKVVKVDV